MPVHTVFRFIARIYALQAAITWVFDAVEDSTSIGEASGGEIASFAMTGILQLGFVWWLFVNADNVIKRLNLERGFDGPLVVSKLDAKTLLHVVILAMGGFFCVDAVSEGLMELHEYLTAQAAPVVDGQAHLSQNLLMQPLYFIIGIILLINAYRIAPFLATLKSSDQSSD